MAEGLLRHKLELRGLKGRIHVDSAGTHAGQPGRAPDARAQRVCKARGVDIGRSRARQVGTGDYERFDHILAADRRNHDWLMSECPEAFRSRIALVGAWAKIPDIPDPYFGNEEGFTRVHQLLDDSLEAFLTAILVERA